MKSFSFSVSRQITVFTADQKERVSLGYDMCLSLESDDKDLCVVRWWQTRTIGPMSPRR
jgi:hypothetical protein